MPKFKFLPLRLSVVSPVPLARRKRCRSSNFSFSSPLSNLCPWLAASDAEVPISPLLLSVVRALGSSCRSFSVFPNMVGKAPVSRADHGNQPIEKRLPIYRTSRYAYRETLFCLPLPIYHTSRYAYLSSPLQYPPW